MLSRREPILSLRNLVRFFVMSEQGSAFSEELKGLIRGYTNLNINDIKNKAKFDFETFQYLLKESCLAK